MRFYWFWLFLLYSFGGYVLEKLYAAARRSPHQVRKCFLLLPLCPVYGLAMLAVLLVFVADCFLSARVLRRGGDIDLLSLRRLASALRTA